MTVEEAKEAIKEVYGDSEYTDEIIKALELQQEWGGLHDYMVKERIKQCRFGTISMLVADCLIKLPSVTPQQKVGKWILKHRKHNSMKWLTGTDEYGIEHTVKKYEEYECDEPYCSECGKLAGDTSQNYCCACGAIMEVES